MARRTISQAEALLNGRADVTEEQMSGASVVEVSLTSGNKSITSFGGRSITLLLPVNAGAFQAGQALHRIPDQRRRRGREVGWRLPEPERRALGKGQHDPIGHLCCSTAGTAGAAPLHRRA